MISERDKKRLADLGFEFCEHVTGPDPTWGTWDGTIDPIGKTSIDGECMGLVVYGDTKREMIADAMKRARDYAPHLRPCEDLENCDMHGNVEED